MATEPEGVTDSGFDFYFTCDIGDIVKVTLRVLVFKVNGRRNDSFFDGFKTSKDFDSTSRTKKVTGHGFSRGNKKVVFRMITKGEFDGLRFRDVSKRGGGSVGVDIGHVLRVELSMLQ